MNRPDYVTDEDIERWETNIQNDPNMPKEVLSIPILKEVCYAGLWLAESLAELGCPEEKIRNIQFNAGRYAFGRDPWQAHEAVLEFWKKLQNAS